MDDEILNVHAYAVFILLGLEDYGVCIMVAIQEQENDDSRYFYRNITFSDFSLQRIRDKDRLRGQGN